jgi:hypothetical protein
VTITKLYRRLIGFASCLAVAAGSLAAQDQVRNLKPFDFRELPPKVREALDSSSCTIPQPPSTPSSNPHLQNVIRGEFQQKGEFQWAVLCQRPDRGVSVLVFGDSGQKPAVAATFTADQHACWTLITAVGKHFINEHHRTYGGRKPPPIDHQGIDYGICEKASVVYYYYQGHWLELAGAD